MPPEDSKHRLQTQPKRRWRRIKALKENAGGFNGGIHQVEDVDAPGKTYIEKVATHDFIRYKLIDREIAILKHLSTPPHPHITEMVDHYVDRGRGKASIYLKYCNMNGLDSVIRNRRAAGELFNELEVWQWFIQLFDALTYCHFGPEKDAHLKMMNGERYRTDWNVVWHRGEQAPSPGRTYMVALICIVIQISSLQISWLRQELGQGKMFSSSSSSAISDVPWRDNMFGRRRRTNERRIHSRHLAGRLQKRLHMLHAATYGR
jgi:hypothetical protein